MKNQSLNPIAVKHSARPLCVVLLALAMSGVAAPRAAADPVARDLAKVVRALPRGADAGFVVCDAKTGDDIFEHGADQLLKPASLQKLFVTAAAIERFGPDFRFETRVHLKDRELRVVGGGDPALGDERIAKRDGRPPSYVFDAWAAGLASRGVTALDAIVLDDSVFDRDLRHADWPDAQADRWYQAPVSGLNLNNNCVDVAIDFGEGRLRLDSEPALPVGWFDNQLGMGKSHNPVLRRPANSAVFELRGSVRKKASFDSAAVLDPTALFGDALQVVLEKHGVKVGEVRRASSAADPAASPAAGAAAEEPLFATHATPLDDVLWRCNTFSQNMFAECLLKALGAYTPEGRRGAVSGSWESGRAAMLAALGRMGVDVRTAEFRDGSGLSHQNRSSARQLVELLLAMKRHAHGERFTRSLARAGEPGSMRSRYDDPALRGRLIGKTGTLNDVVALAGYATRADGREFAFAFVINGSNDIAPLVRAGKVLVGE